MPDMTPTSLAVVVAPRTGKIIKYGLSVFKRGENLLKMVYYTYVKPIIRNFVAMLEFTQTKNGLFKMVYYSLHLS